MSELTEVDYGPLQQLIGVWEGDKGLDMAPDPEGDKNSPYYETITYAACGNVTNAETQELAVIYYHQIVSRKVDDAVFHDQTGYWSWDAERQLLMHSLTIPRGVCILAGGQYAASKISAGQVVMEVAANVHNSDWGIIQSPFMAEKARTTSFSQRITLGKGRLCYAQTTMVDIYGKSFEHTDENELRPSS